MALTPGFARFGPERRESDESGTDQEECPGFRNLSRILPSLRGSEREIIERVIDLIEFAPPSTLLYSVSGCKKVQQKVDFVIESLRPMYTTTKKKKKTKQDIHDDIW